MSSKPSFYQPRICLHKRSLRGQPKQALPLEVMDAIIGAFLLSFVCFLAAHVVVALIWGGQ